MAHHHHAGHGHGHIDEHADIRPLRLALILTGTVFVAQVVGGFVSGSLALLSDAGHVLVDLASLLIAFIGLRVAAKARNRHDARFTFGLRRIEILAAMTNGFLLLGMCIYIIIEAIKRFWEPHHVHAGIMLWVAVVGFVANAISAILLHRSSHITTRSAYLHVLTDLMSSGGVIVGAVIMNLVDADWLDPVISLLIAAVIIRGAVTVIRQTGTILMESAPDHIKPDAVRAALMSLDDVANVHDVHIWQLGNDDYTASVHVVTSRQSDDMIATVQAVMRTSFGIQHTTVQVESHDLHDHGECGAC
ncbi:MAG: cation diffusion facilitator family transporter [Candidatus Kapabacteria bacterium]|jgi:cobalt-zinc-cadmium efflux system protein|nr:cation diffusion facilitator family transporter [Candidatus Kapabacteria bacterium]